MRDQRTILRIWKRFLYASGRVFFSGTESIPALPQIRMAGAVILLFFGVFGAWSVAASLTSAVVAAGAVAVETHVKTVQHPDGGIISAIHVRNGDRVEAGDLLLRLDDTLTRASLALVTKSIDELLVRRSRLLAERNGETRLQMPPELSERSGQDDIAAMLMGEQALLDSILKSTVGKKGMLRQRVDQLAQEATGLEARRAAKAHEIELIQRELTGIAGLHDQGLVTLNRLTALERAKTQLEGELGQLVAEIARNKGRSIEMEMEILQIDQDRRTSVLGELRDVDAQLAQLAERRLANLDKLTRVDIRAPQSGVIHELAVHTIGGVIGAGEPLMRVVPGGDALVVEARVRPADIDQLAVGQSAFLRFTAFNQRTTPEINGIVETISASITHTPGEAEGHYVARIRFDADREKLGGLPLVPGMPVDVFVRTGERSPLSYFLKPLSDQVARAFRED